MRSPIGNWLFIKCLYLFGVLLLVLSIIFVYPDVANIIENNFFLILAIILIVSGIILHILSYEPRYTDTDGKKEKDTRKLDLIVNIIAIIATILAALFGAYLGTSGSRDLIKQQNLEIKHNVANALKTDIMSIRDDWSANIIPEDESDLDNNTCMGYIPMNPLYSNQGVYYAYQAQIASFNPNLSLSLFDFYTKVNHLEMMRESLNIADTSAESNVKIPITDWTGGMTSTSNNFTESQIQNISTLFPWGSDLGLKTCTIGVIDPDLTPAQNYARIIRAREAYNLENGIIEAYKQIPDLLNQLNQTLNETNSY